MRQPEWSLLYQTNDKAILLDDTDEYAPEMIFVEEDESDEDNPIFQVFRFSLDKMKLVDGYLVSDNYNSSWPHPLPNYEEWFVKHLPNVASCIGAPLEELREAFTSDDAEHRSWAYESVGSCEGFVNLDSYPLTLNKSEFRQYWRELSEHIGSLPPEHLKPTQFSGAKTSGEQGFIDEVIRLYRRGITSSDYIARQMVDDYYRSTGTSLHLKQHKVNKLVKAVLAEYDLPDDNEEVAVQLNGSLPFDPFEELDKRQRLALRQALKGGSASAPTKIVKSLEKLGLVIRTGHNYEPQEWGKVIRSEPIFYLTDLGKEVAQFIVNKLTND